MHLEYLLRALALASHRRGFCSPNPAVGALLVEDGHILSSACHQAAGQAHAEQAVFQSCIAPITEKTILYVTLEPCNHWGKTPPCTDVIISSGIKKVVYAYRDPNPCVADTITLLKEQGIECVHYPVDEINAFYRSYYYWMVNKKSFLTAKMAMSLDAKIAHPDGSPCQLTNESVNVFTHQQRRQSDCLMTTAKTILSDRPHFTARVDNDVNLKPLAIVDRQLSLSMQERVFSYNRPVYIFCDEHSAIPTELPDNVTIIRVASVDNHLNTECILTELAALGFHDVWLECGGQYFSALLASGIINKMYLYYTSQWLGADALPAYVGKALQFTKQNDVSWEKLGNAAIACFDFNSICGLTNGDKL